MQEWQGVGSRGSLICAHVSRFIVDDFPAISFTRTEALSANGTEAGAAITLHAVRQGQVQVQGEGRNRSQLDVGSV